MYISVDLEGIYGVDRFDEFDYDNPDYQSWKKQAGKITGEEVLALYQGLVQRGFSQVVAFDGHGNGDTLSLPPKYFNLTQARCPGSDKVCFPGMDSSFAGVILWGYHVKAGSKNGKLGHTHSRKNVKNIKVNGREVGEVYLSALFAACRGVPLIAVSGDQGLKIEVENDIGNVPFFNSDSGAGLPRGEYLSSIRDFIINLDFEAALALNNNLVWPSKTTLQVTYKKPSVNLGRWLLRKQFKYADLKGISSSIYKKGSFARQWNRYCGFKEKNENDDG